MNKLEELLQRATIKFPFPISADEIKKRLLVNIFTDLNSNEQKGSGFLNYHTETYRDFTQTDSREYTLKITGQIMFILRQTTLASANFEFGERSSSEEENLFKSIRFFVTPGYNSIEEFASLFPSGKAQLELMDYMRKSVERYFSKRSKE